VKELLGRDDGDGGALRTTHDLDESVVGLRCWGRRRRRRRQWGDERLLELNEGRNECPLTVCRPEEGTILAQDHHQVLVLVRRPAASIKVHQGLAHREPQLLWPPGCKVHPVCFKDTRTNVNANEMVKKRSVVFDQDLKTPTPQDIKGSRDQEINTSRHQGIKRSKHQGIKGSRDQDINTSAHQEIKRSRDQDLKRSRDRGVLFVVFHTPRERTGDQR